MATKPKPNIGTAKCPICEATAHVRKGATGLFVHCTACGPVLNKGKGYQERILNTATLWGPEGDPAAPVPSPVPVAPPAPAPSPIPAPVATPAAKPRFSTLLG